MHVLAVPAPITLSLETKEAPQAPYGLVRAATVGVPERFEGSHPALKLGHEQANVSSGIESGKFGFPPQTLYLKQAGKPTLVLSPTEIKGEITTSPDFGYITQVWVGGDTKPFAELEQTSPSLDRAADGTCSSAIYLSIIKSD